MLCRTIIISLNYVQFENENFLVDKHANFKRKRSLVRVGGGDLKNNNNDNVKITHRRLPSLRKMTSDTVCHRLSAGSNLVGFMPNTVRHPRTHTGSPLVSLRFRVGYGTSSYTGAILPGAHWRILATYWTGIRHFLQWFQYTRISCTILRHLMYSTSRELERIDSAHFEYFGELGFTITICDRRHSSQLDR